MMEEAEILFSIAEVGVGLAGFGGIAASIGYRSAGSWLDHDKVRITWLILYSLAAVFASFVPHMMFYLGLVEPWFFASGLLTAVPVLSLYTLYGIAKSGIPDGYSGASIVLITALHITTLLILVSIVLGLVPGKEFGCYLAAVLLILLQASFLFLRLLSTAYQIKLMSTPNDSTTDNNAEISASNEELN